jgi:transcription initiation factor TFIIF subunit alpha
VAKEERRRSFSEMDEWMDSDDMSSSDDEGEDKKKDDQDSDNDSKSKKDKGKKTQNLKKKKKRDVDDEAFEVKHRDGYGLFTDDVMNGWEEGVVHSLF